MSTLVVMDEEQLRSIVADAVKEGVRAALNDKPMTTREVSEFLEVTIDSVGKMVRRDGLPAERIGRSYRFQRSEVIDWLRQRRQNKGSHVGRRARQIERIK